MEKKTCCHCSQRKKERSPEEYTHLIHRLNRIEGQIRGIRAMVENDVYCPDILVQSAAVNAAVMLGAPAAPQVTDALGAAGAGAFWAAGVERIAAMALHMALSILVWMAVTRRVPIWYYFAAVLLHAAANIPAALSQLGLLRSMWCIEGIILAVNAAVCLFVWSVYRKACVHRPLAG